jgi:serine/threonine protein kinase
VKGSEAATSSIPTSPIGMTGVVFPPVAGELTEVKPIAPGALVAGIYRIVRCLGMGRTGAVYLCEVAEEEGKDPPPVVAVKLLSRAIAAEGDRNPLYVRFHREVDAIFRIAHPNVVSAFQAIRHDGLVGYSMDFVEGGSLARLVGASGGLEERIAVSLLEQISRGLEAIHAAGVIHRDIKPENILLTPQKQPKISDFGVAYCGFGSRLTSNGALVGTVQYLSPEYLEKGVVSRQGDVYALGVVAYELVTGSAPFVGLGLYEAIDAKVSGDAPDPRDRNPRVSPELAEVIQRALSPSLERRYRSAAEFGHSVRSLEGRGGTVNRGGASAARARRDREESTEKGGTGPGEGRSSGRERLMRTVLLAIGALLIGLGILFVWSGLFKRTGPGTASPGSNERTSQKSQSTARTYSITRAIPASVAERFDEEEDVYD